MSGYEPPTVTGTGLLPGVRLLNAHLTAMLGFTVTGGYNPRCVLFHPTRVGSDRCGMGHRISHHAESRATDVMTADRAVHERLTVWALGVEGQAWGVQEVVTGWGPSGGPQRWERGRGWAAYVGPSSHRDHVHLSLDWVGARRTSAPEGVVAVQLVDVVVRCVDGRGEAVVWVDPDRLVSVSGPTAFGAVAQVGWRADVRPDGGRQVVVAVEDWFPGTHDVSVRVAFLP